MLRVVLDTNIFVSSLLAPSGVPAAILKAWRERRYILLVSPDLIQEIRLVLNHSRIRSKYPIDEEDISGLFQLLSTDTEITEVRNEISGIIPADPKDDMILSCAAEGAADVIVSGDHHLLNLKTFQNVPICSARQFLEDFLASGLG